MRRRPDPILTTAVIVAWSIVVGLMIYAGLTARA